MCYIGYYFFRKTNVVNERFINMAFILNENNKNCCFTSSIYATGFAERRQPEPVNRAKLSKTN